MTVCAVKASKMECFTAQTAAGFYVFGVLYQKEAGNPEKNGTKRMKRANSSERKKLEPVERGWKSGEKWDEKDEKSEFICKKGDRSILSKRW